MSKELKVGILGLGHLHPRTYMPHFEAARTTVVAVADQMAELREPFAADFGVNAYADWAELLEKEDIDLAYIFLPHCDCAPAAIACAEKGVNVIVEKPVANTAKAAADIDAACKKAGVFLSTPYAWRYHPVTRKMKQVIDSGVLGRIVGCEGRCAAGGVHRYIEGHSPWMLQREKSGGGPMYNLGVHWIDLYRWLLGSEVVEVMGKNVHVNTDYDIEDNSFAIATFNSGVTLSLDISYTVPDSFPHGRDLYLGIRGTEGCITFAPSFESPSQTLFVCSNSPDFGGAPRQTIQFDLPDTGGYAGSMGREFVEDTADRIIGGKAPFITGEDAVKVLEVVEGIYQAAEGGKAVKLG